MISNKIIATIVILIAVVFSGIVVLIGVSYFNWFKNKNNDYIVYSPKKITVKDNLQEKETDEKTGIDEKIIQKEDVVKENKTTIKIESLKTEEKKVSEIKKGENKTVEQKNNVFVKKESIDVKKDLVNINKDGSPIISEFVLSNNQNFHSYGEFVSSDEYKYRLSLINNLKVKTIVIDSVSKGNGISQEYYKVVFNEKMIPAKILDDLVESKEFRDLIPQKYLKIEDKIAKFENGDKLFFKNEDIKKLLILWSQGKLTPIQKAWKVKATL